MSTYVAPSSPNEALTIIERLLTALQLRWKQDGPLTTEALSSVGRDIKLEADYALQKEFDAALLPYGLPVMGEENKTRLTVGIDTAYWVVDPMDGSYNFHRGFPYYGTALAYCIGDKAVAGGLLNLGTGDLFLGGPGLGARKNGQTMQVSTLSEPKQAALLTGIPKAMQLDDPASVMRFAETLRQFKKVRMMGSAAMALSLVADGTFDAYREDGIFWWDVAAGLAIIEGAGGSVQVSGGAPASGAPLVASAAATKPLLQVLG